MYIIICVGHTARAPEGREGRYQAGLKGRSLEVGARRAPRLLVNNNDSAPKDVDVLSCVLSNVLSLSIVFSLVFYLVVYVSGLTEWYF